MFEQKSCFRIHTKNANSPCWPVSYDVQYVDMLRVLTYDAHIDTYVLSWYDVQGMYAYRMTSCLPN